MSENTITLIGRLTADPELKFTNSGKAVVKFSIAVDKRWQNKQSQEWETKTSFFNVSAWDHLAEHVAESMKKGYRVIVTGIMEQRTWETDSGEKRNTFDLTADGVGPDLRFVTCTLKQSERASGNAPAQGPVFDDDPF